MNRVLVYTIIVTSLFSEGAHCFAPVTEKVTSRGGRFLPSYEAFAIHTVLAAAGQPRKARRDLKKRRRRRRREDATSGMNNQDEADDFWIVSESRPINKSRAIELGQDYWIDEEELKREKEREMAARVKKPGQVPDEKLWSEVLSPYRQNWIGLFSVVIVVLVFLVQKFPELTDYPVIPLPDL